MENLGRYVRAPNPREEDSDDEYEWASEADSNASEQDFSEEKAPEQDSSEEEASELESSGEEDGDDASLVSSDHGSSDDDVDVSSAETSGQNAPVGKEGNNPQAIGVPNQREIEMSGQSQERDTTDPEHNRSITTTVEPQGGEGAASEMLQRMENVLAAITDKISYLENMQMVHTPMATTPDSDQTWSTPNIATVPSGGHVMSVRCDNVKPFPSGVPANKLWETWNGYIEIFEMSANLAGVNDPVKRSQLLYLSVGEELQGVITAAKLRPSLNDPDCYQRFVANIHNYFRSMMDPAAEHENFSKLRQGKTESALAFHARLTSKVRLCGYNPGDHEMFVRSQLLKGLRNKKLAKNARIYGQATNDVVLSAGRSDCLESEIADPDSPSIDRPEVYAVQQQKPFEPRFNAKRNSPNERADKQVDKRPRRENQVKGRRSRCSRCGGLAHGQRQCPASQRICAACGERGHYAAVCREFRIRQVKGDPSNGDEDGEDQQVNALSLRDVLVDCRLGASARIRFMVDSGADVNVIGGADWNHLKRATGRQDLRTFRSGTAKDLHAYGSQTPMIIKHTFEAEITAPGPNAPTVTAAFYVVQDGLRSLLGRSTASDLGLLKVGTAVNALGTAEKITPFPKVPGVKIKFSVDKTVPPVKNAYYNVPAAFRDAAKRRLEEMEQSGIIEKVLTAPTWISGMSAVPKGQGDFRLVVNMRAPNKAINREYYRLPLIDEMKTMLHGSTCFTKLDFKSAFYHLELSEDSRELTTFLTEGGMYRFTRLLFGVNCAPEAFQREMARIFKGVRNIIIYIDDILIFAISLEELRKTTSEVLRIIRANNLTLNKDKCEFEKERIKFLGHELDKDGFHVDDSKIRSIRNFREPTNASELRSFLGLASYISPHVKQFADITGPLWEIVSAKSWNWGPRQSRAFEEIRNKIAACCVTLGFFCEKDKTILYTDASPIALGAVLVQEDADGSTRIISFASKALSETEKKYPQHQREALATVWAVEHFSFYLLGRFFVLRTDAKGVSFILNRTREYSKRALTRADGWALRLSPYRMQTEYVRGSENIADSPSRLYDGVDKPFNDEWSPWEIASVEANAVTFMGDQEIKTATLQDATLQGVIEALKSGRWPKNLHKYQLLQGDLVVRDGMLLKTGCVVMPETLRKRSLEIAHMGHPSAAKLKSILRQRVWWPGMPSDAQKWVDSCSTCAVTGMPERPTPMQRIFAPKAVWETIAVDFNGPYARFGGIYILVIVDYRSRYLVARPIKSTSFERTEKAFDDVFEREGLPKYIKSDNGPPFNGEEYKRYCVERGITPIFSTPLFPQQNGLAEVHMKIVNKAMTSATVNKTNYVEELRDAVNAHNAAAHSVTRVPPEEVMSGRKIKRGLPLANFEKVTIDEELLNDRDRSAKLEGKIREDKRRGARKCRVQPGDQVLVEKQTRGKGDPRFSSVKHTVVEENNGSLVLHDEHGQVVKRHVSQTKKVNEWRKSTEAVDEARDHSDQGNARTSQVKKVPAPDHPDAARGNSRTIRDRKAPSYLKDYVQVIHE